MIRLHQENVNTPAAYDSMYSGTRRIEMSAVVPLQVLLPALVHHGDWILDVGCGVGQYFPYLTHGSLTTTVVGIDFAPQSVEEAKHQGYAQTREADFAKEGFAFPDGTFDLVFCSEVLEHMEDPQFIVNEARRVLKRGGHLLATTPYRDMLPNVEHLWAFDEDDMRTLFAAFTIATHFRFSVGLGDHFEHLLALARK